MVQVCGHAFLHLSLAVHKSVRGLVACRWRTVQLGPLNCRPVCAIIGGDAVLAQDRPGFDFDQLTWADHNCRIYEVPAAPMHSICR